MQKHTSEPDADESDWTPFVISVPMLVVVEGTMDVNSEQPVKLIVDKVKTVKKPAVAGKQDVGSVAIFQKLSTASNVSGGRSKKRKAVDDTFKHLLS